MQLNTATVQCENWNGRNGVDLWHIGKQKLKRRYRWRRYSSLPKVGGKKAYGNGCLSVSFFVGVAGVVDIIAAWTTQQKRNAGVVQGKNTEAIDVDNKGIATGKLYVGALSVVCILLHWGMVSTFLLRLQSLTKKEKSGGYFFLLVVCGGGVEAALWTAHATSPRQNWPLLSYDYLFREKRL